MLSLHSFSSILSFLESLSRWEKMDLFGLSLVVTGIAGEVLVSIFSIWLPYNPTNFPELDKIFVWKKKHLEIACGVLVVIGIGLEFRALPRALNESHETIAVLNKEAGDAKVLVSQIETTNAQLVATNLVLQKELQPRIIMYNQITNFMFLMEKTKKIPITVSVGPENGDNLSFASQIRSMLNDAKFEITNSNDFLGLERNGLELVRNLGREEQNPSVYFLLYSTNVAYQTPIFNYEFKNGFKRPIDVGTNDFRVYGAIRDAFNQVGIIAQWYGTSNCVGDGQFKIFISPKGI